jgi:hypothetical protein
MESAKFACTEFLELYAALAKKIQKSAHSPLRFIANSSPPVRLGGVGNHRQIFTEVEAKNPPYIEWALKLGADGASSATGYLRGTGGWFLLFRARERRGAESHIILLVAGALVMRLR